MYLLTFQYINNSTVLFLYDRSSITSKYESTLPHTPRPTLLSLNTSRILGVKVNIKTCYTSVFCWVFLRNLKEKHLSLLTSCNLPLSPSRNQHHLHMYHVISSYRSCPTLLYLYDSNIPDHSVRSPWSGCIDSHHEKRIL